MEDLEDQVKKYKLLMSYINKGHHPNLMLDVLYRTLHQSNPDKAEKCIELGWGLTEENNLNSVLDVLYQTILDDDFDKIKRCREVGWKLAEGDHPDLDDPDLDGGDRLDLDKFLLCYKMYTLAAAIEMEEGWL